MVLGGSHDKAAAAEVLGTAAPVVATAIPAPWAEPEAAIAAGATRTCAETWAASVLEEEESCAAVWDGKEPPTDLELFNLLASLNSNGANPCPQHIHKVSVRSAAPEDLFKRHQPHAPGKGHGKDDTCYFYNQAPPIKSINKKGVEKRDRKVKGGGIWHPEKKCEPIHGADGSVIGNKRRFSYQSTGGVPSGWILFELSPAEKQEDGVDQMVLCTIHKSKRKHPETSTAASSAGAETPSVELGHDEAEEGDGSASVDEQLCSPGEDISSPAKVCAAQMPALAISPTSTSNPGSQPRPEAAAPTRMGKSVVDVEEAPYREKAATGLAFGRSSTPSTVEWIKEVSSISTKLLRAAERAVSSDFKKAPEIDEFLIVQEVLLRIIDELRLDRSIVSDSLEKLEILRQYLVMVEHMTPETRTLLVSLGADMTDLIFSAYINETVKRAKQAFNVLKEIGSDAQMIEQSWASKAKHNVQLIHSVLHEVGSFFTVEGAENECPGPVNSSVGASSPSTKRKADHDHEEAPPSKKEEAPPSVRQELTGKDREQLNQAERFLLFDDDMLAGTSHKVHQAALYADIFNVDGSSVMQAQQQGVAEAAEVAVEILPAEWWSPGAEELPDLSMGDGFLDMPIGDGLLDMFIGGELVDMTIGDISCPAPEFALCASGLHVAADCQKLCCGLSMTDESVAFDNWAWS